MYEMMAGQPPFEADNEDVSKTFLTTNAKFKESLYEGNFRNSSRPYSTMTCYSPYGTLLLMTVKNNTGLDDSSAILNIQSQILTTF